MRGGATALAAEIGVTAPLIYQWMSGHRRVAAERCLQIARVTNGAIKCEDLRPDLDWAASRLPDHTGQNATPVSSDSS